VTGGRILVAGIGNVFLADDGFGVEVVSRLDRSALPDVVDVADYGIRGVHLAYELLGGRYDTLVLVDAVPSGEAPGTISVLDVTEEQDEAGPASGDAFHAPVMDGHGLHPQAVLGLIRTLGGRVGRVLVVGCQPELVEERMGLSPTVDAAVDEALAVLTEVLREEAGRERATPAEIGAGNGGGMGKG
jgi:hydrogenase maturation protease